MGKSLVSVIVPVYNGEEFIKEALTSVLNQTYENIELIVVNDGSVDASEEIIKEMEKDLKERFIDFKYFYQENKGVSSAVNRGISVSNGEYIVTLAQDDVQKPNLVEKLLSIIENLNEEYCMVCADAEFIDKYSKKVFLSSSMEASYEKKENFFEFFLDLTTHYREFDIKKDFGKYSSLLLGNYIPINATIIRKKHILDIGMFTVGSYIEDWDLWIRLSKKYKFYLYKTPVLKYRWHGNNTSKIHRKKLIISSMEILLREYSYAKEKNLYNLWISSFILHINLLNELLKDEKIKSITEKMKKNIDDIEKNKKLLEKIKKYTNSSSHYLNRKVN